LTSNSEQPPDIDDLLTIVRAKRANRLLLRARPNVIGLDIGFRSRQGEETQERVVKVYVSQKIDESFLSEWQRLPATVRINDREIGVDVEQRAIPHTTNFTLRDRPLRGGMSISLASDYHSGTLGICVKHSDGHAYILSNNHVLTRNRQTSLGVPVVQPSQPDGGFVPDDMVGVVTSFVPIDFGFTTITITPPVGTPEQIQVPNPNFVDAALAQLIDVNPKIPQQIYDSFNVGNRELHWIGYPRQLMRGRWSDEQKLLLLETRVCKMGRTTGFTSGVIASTSWDGYIDGYYDGKAWFEDQITIVSDTPGQIFSAGGDSGSLVVTYETGEPPTLALPPAIRGTDPVGLLFAGTGTGTGYANPLDAVLDELAIDKI
jgi:hypothetical protein